MHALITGASGALGAAMAQRFAAAGYDLTLVARRKEMLDDLAAAMGRDVFVRPADLSDPELAAGIVDEAQERLGPIDVLINNAGVQYVEPTAGVSLERIQRMMNINTVTPMAFMQAVMPGMTARRSGAIVNVASMAAIAPTPGMVHYNGSKAALAAATESLRVELRDHGVHVLAVYPGPVESDMEAAGREKYPPTLLVKFIPTGTPDVLAELVYRGVVKRHARVVYPRVYSVARWFRVTSEWFTREFTPKLPPGQPQ